MKMRHLSVTTACVALSAGLYAADAERPGLVARYAGSYDTEPLLAEPDIRAALEDLLGSELPHFLQNLDVRGSVDLVSGNLSLEGNAPHGGTEEEAVLCVNAYSRAVTVAILSKGAITIYSRSPAYEDQPLCIKDWITQANSGHRDRLLAPDNVRVHVVPED